MSCTSDMCRKIAVWVLCLIQIGVTVGIIVVLAEDLQKVDVSIKGGSVEWESAQCLLGADWRGHSLCSYAYAVCAGGLVASLIIACVMCCTCQLYGLAATMNALLSALGTAWWVAASVVFTQKGMEANDASLPQQSWRNMVLVMCWVVSIMFAAGTLVLLADAITSCCCRRDAGKGKYEKYDP